MNLKKYWNETERSYFINDGDQVLSLWIEPDVEDKGAVVLGLSYSNDFMWSLANFCYLNERTYIKFRYRKGREPIYECDDRSDNCKYFEKYFFHHTNHDFYEKHEELIFAILQDLVNVKGCNLSRYRLERDDDDLYFDELYC